LFLSPLKEISTVKNPEKAQHMEQTMEIKSTLLFVTGPKI
jgi:hypothetical protein